MSSTLLDAFLTAWAARRWVEARECWLRLGTAIQQEPRLWWMAAEMYAQLNDHSSSAFWWSRMVQHQPEEPAPALGYLHAMVRLPASPALYSAASQLCAQHPKRPRIQLAAAAVFLCLNKPQDAERAIVRAEGVLGANPDLRWEAGRARYGLGHSTRALAHVRAAAVGWAKAKDWSNANKALALAQQLAPDDGNFQAMQVAVWSALGRYAEAAALAETCQPTDAIHYGHLARFWTRQEKLDRAIAAWQAALDLRPRWVIAWAQLAVLWEQTRKVARAREAAENAIACAPNRTAMRVLVRLDHQEGNLARAIERCYELLAVPADDHAQIWMEVALLERRLGNAHAAVAAANQGHALREQASRERQEDLTIFPENVRAIRSWTPQLATFSADERGHSPVFLLGFPRSGTTLVQQVLQAHPNLVTLDERDPLRSVLRRWQKANPGRFRSFPGCFDSFSPAEWRNLQDDWWRDARSFGWSDGQIVVDKMPLNIILVDVLTHLFPQSRVIVCIRDPRDCVLSNFFQDFVPNSAMMQFRSIAGAAELYADVMSVWLDRRRHLTVPFLELSYEALTASPDAEITKLLSFVGVEDHADAHAHEIGAQHRSIRTPSRYDVSRPVHREAVGRWRQFADVLAPHMAILAPFLAEWGYSEEID